MTILCALSHWSLPAHHSAASAGAASAGGFDFDKLRLNSARVMRDLAAILPPPLRRKPPRSLLDDVAEREQRLLVERAADELEPERQALRRQAARNGNSGQARHVHCHREHVVEIHFDWIRPTLLADAEGG